MSIRMQLTPEAEADIQDIWRYTVRIWGESQADSYIAKLESGCMALCRNPSLGRPIATVSEDIHAYHCEHHYAIYMYGSQRLIVLAFLHERMDLMERIRQRLWRD